MKKVIILALTLLISMSLMACGGDETDQTDRGETKAAAEQTERGEDVSNNDEDGDIKDNEGEKTDEVTGETKKSESSGENEIKETKSPSQSETRKTVEETKKPTMPSVEESKQAPKVTEAAKASYKKVNDTRYAKSAVNVRSGPSASHSKLGALTKGQQVTRIGVADNGWGVISFNGKEGYVSGNYLVSSKPVEVAATTAPTKSTGGGTSKPTQPASTKPAPAQPAPTKPTQPTQPAPTTPPAKDTYTPVKAGWIFEKSAAGTAINATQKAQIDSWAHTWSRGGMSDAALKSTLEDYLIQEGIPLKPIGIDGNSFFISEKTPEITFDHGAGIPYRYYGTYSSGQKDNKSDGNFTVFYSWDLIIY